MFITFVLAIEYVLEFMESTKINAISKAYMDRPPICLLPQADHTDGEKCLTKLNMKYVNG